MKNIEKIIAFENATLKDLLVKLDNAPQFDLPGGILLIVDENGYLKGSVTDGDIRRAILKSDTMEIVAADIMVQNPIVFPETYSIQEILEELSVELEKRNRKSKRFLSKIILIDAEKKPSRVLDYHQLWEQRVATHRHICVVGLGYVGLTLALVLAEKGYLVTGIDTDSTRIDSLQRSESYVHENGLQELLREQINRNLRVAESIPEGADVFIISVGTPIDLQSGKPSMQYLDDALEGISKHLRRGNLVVLRSTVPIGTCRDCVKERLEKNTGLKCGLDFHLSFAPERTAEGKALKELRSLPQIIGGFNSDSVEATYAIFREVTPTIIKVDSLEAAEMAKLINNTFRDYIFAFSNEMAKIASHFNINVFDVIRAANEGYPRDPVPFPSPGVGGPCLTKDPFIFAHVAEAANQDGEIFRKGRRINLSMHSHVVESLDSKISEVGKQLKSASVLVCGLSFKGIPETGDMRDSSSVAIAIMLKARCGKIYGYDAVASDEEIRSMGIIPVKLPDGFRNMDAVLFLNNHKSFERVDVFEMVRSMNNNPIIYDGWDLFAEDDVLQARSAIYMGLSFTKSSVKA